MKITREIFSEQCKPRFGRSNPERMHLEYWDWMIRTLRGPYFVRQELGLESNFPQCGSDGCVTHAGPDWCFERFGQTQTHLPDGRVVCIAGEHEDYYDPDFCIYNDVVVLRPAAGQTGVTVDTGEVEIYAYPQRDFPPTDFHSATVVDRKIYLIGRLGYANARHYGETPVFSLDLDTYRIEPHTARGPAPGWINSHSAWFDAQRQAIVVRSGKVWRSKKDERPNLAVHRLHLADMRWERVADRDEQRCFVVRRRGTQRAAADLQAFRPSVPHEWLTPTDRGVTTCQFIVDGVRITLEHWVDEIEIRVEGELAVDVRDQFLSELINYLCTRTECAWTTEQVEESDLRSRKLLEKYRRDA